MSSTFAVAAALAVALPAQFASGGDKRASANEPQESQYSSSDETYSPKEEGARSSGAGSTGVSAEAERRQYSSRSDARSDGARSDSDRSEMRKSDRDDRSLASLPSTKLSELRGADVYSSDGEKVGEVSDFVLDFDSGEISRVLIDNEGVFTGARLVDAAALSGSDREDRLDLAMSAEEYERAPDFSKRDALRDNMGPVWNHATMPPAVAQPAPATAAGTSDMAAKDHPAAMESESRVENHPRLAFAREVIDSEIETRDGQEIGEVEALALSGSSVYAIVGDLEDEARLPANVDRIAIRIDTLDRVGDDDLAADIALSDIRELELVAAPEGDSGYDFRGERIIALAKPSDLAAVRR